MKLNHCWVVFLIGILSVQQTFAQSTVAPFDVKKYAAPDLDITHSSINLSLYAYHDLNHNGVYDLGDFGMSGLYVSLLKEGNTIALSQTNNAGYANFRTAFQKQYAEITEPGDYEFVVMLPPNWHVTSNNATQLVAITANPNKASGLTLEDYLEPVGMAPNKFIAGVYDFKSAGVVELYHQSKLIEKQNLQPDQRFQFDVPEGEYQLKAGQFEREVLVSNAPVYVGSLNRQFARGGQPITVTFDDVSEHPLYKIPRGYAGLLWKDINTIRRDHTHGLNLGYVNGLRSGDMLAYTSQSRPGEISSSIPFDFVGVYLSAAWQKAEGKEVVVEMWRGEEKVITDTLMLSTLAPIHYKPQVPDVTRVVFTSKNSLQIVFDDMTIARCDYFICQLKRKFIK